MPVEKPLERKMQAIEHDSRADEEASLDQGTVIGSVGTLLKATGFQIIGSILLSAALIWFVSFIRLASVQ